MEWITALFGLVGVGIGSGISILIEWMRSHVAEKQRAEERREQRERSVRKLYSAFMVSFQEALLLNEQFYEHVAHRQPPPHEGAESRVVRIHAETRTRDLAWQICLHERDADIRSVIQEMGSAFDDSLEAHHMQEDIADEYPKSAKKLRQKANWLLDKYHKLYGAH